MINVVPFSRMSVQDRAYPRLLAVISLVTLPNTPSGQILTRIWQYINHLLTYLLTHLTKYGLDINNAKLQDGN